MENPKNFLARPRNAKQENPRRKHRSTDERRTLNGTKTQSQTTPAEKLLTPPNEIEKNLLTPPKPPRRAKKRRSRETRTCIQFTARSLPAL